MYKVLFSLILTSLTLVAAPAMAQINQAPSVNAGPDRAVRSSSENIMLSASARDGDGYITSYAWTKVSGGAAIIKNPNTSKTYVTGLSSGNYVFRVTVTDNKGATASDTLTLSASSTINRAPRITPAPDMTVTLPVDSFIINCNASDPDGDTVTYQWSQISGGAASLSGTSSGTLTVTNSVPGLYIFRVKASDPAGLVATDDIVVNVVQGTNKPPTVSAGADKTIQLPINSVNLNAVASDPENRPLVYNWSKVSGGLVNFSSTTTASTTVSNMSQGIYTFRAKVFDPLNASASDDVRVNVLPANVAPVVSAGNDQVITLPTNNAILNAVASDSDGTVVSYAWAQVSGNTVTLNTANTAQLNVTNMTVGTYVFRVTVTDDKGATSSDDVQVIVDPVNQLPTVNAGSTRTLTLPTNSLSITASAADPDGSIVSYAWSKTAGGNATLGNTGTATVSISNLAEGNYTFRVIVTDNKGATAQASVQVVVNGVPNQLPTVSGGNDQTISLPTNALSLTATASDPDGSIASYAWTKVSGGNATLTNANLATVNISQLVAGTYVFKITVTDNNGGTATDNVTVVVSGSATAPTVDAGADRTIQLPYGSVGITATATYMGGKWNGSWSWAKVSGGSAVMVQTNSARLVVNDLKAGTYVFRVTVTDNKGESAIDDVTVTANASVGNYGRSIPVRTDTDRFTSNPLWRYYEYLPPSYNNDTTKKYPLIIFLHGQGEVSGSNDDINKLITAGGLAKIVHNGKFPDPDKFIVISPQTWAYHTPSYLNDFMAQIVARYRVDTSRMYLTGLSYGAFAIWDYGNTYGETASNVFAAMAPISGNGNSIDGCKYKNIPVWAFHGKLDANGPTHYSASVNPVNKINACSPTTPAKLTLYTDGTHSSNTWDVTYDLSGFNKAQEPDWAPYKTSLYDWFLQYTKP